MREKVNAGILDYVRKHTTLNDQVVHDALALLTLHREVEMLAEAHLARQGLTTRQMDTLEALYHYPEGNLTPAALAEMALLTRSAMTHVLDGLEKKGLIQRGRHPSDRRMVAIALTPAGSAFCEERFPTRYAQMGLIIGRLSPKERTQMRATYLKVIKAIKELLEEGQK